MEHYLIASRIGILILSLKDGFPKRSVFVRFDKLNLDKFCSDSHESTYFVKK